MDQTPDAGFTVAEALGNTDTEYEWHPAGRRDSRRCTYGKPRGVISPLINRILGPDNSANLFMQAQCRALLVIRTRCG